MYEEVCARRLSPDPRSLRSSEGGSGQGGTGVRSLPELAPAGPRSSGPQGGPCAGTGRSPAWGDPGRQDAPEAGPRPLCAGASFFLKGCSQKAPKKLSLPRSFQSWPPAHLGPAGRCCRRRGGQAQCPAAWCHQGGALASWSQGARCGVDGRPGACPVPADLAFPAGSPVWLRCRDPAGPEGSPKGRELVTRALGQEGHLDSPGSRMAVGWGGGGA